MAPGEVFSIVIAAVFVVGIARLLLRERRAAPVRDLVRDDPVVGEFRGVRVQVHPEDPARQTTLKSGGLGNRLVAHTRSLQIGPYSFEASETTMERGRVRFGWRDRDCVILSGTYGGDPIRLALYLDGGLEEIWSAFRSMGIREA